MLYRTSCPVPGCGGRIQYLATIYDESADKLSLDPVEIERVELVSYNTSCGCALNDQEVVVATENVQDELRELVKRRETEPDLRWADLEREMLDRVEARQRQIGQPLKWKCWIGRMKARR